MENKYDRFNALVQTQVKKKRRCLKCGKNFISNGAGHRRCGACDQTIENWSKVRVEGLGI